MRPQDRIGRSDLGPPGLRWQVSINQFPTIRRSHRHVVAANLYDRSHRNVVLISFVQTIPLHQSMVINPQNLRQGPQSVTRPESIGLIRWRNAGRDLRRRRRSPW